MNCCYRVVWSESRRCWMAVGENQPGHTRGRGRGGVVAGAIAAALLALASSTASATCSLAAGVAYGYQPGPCLVGNLSSFTNAGTISSSAADGIRAATSASTVGAITNNGTIATTTSGNGINLFPTAGSTIAVTGDILNTGTIAATGVGMLTSKASISGGISNTGTGVIQGGAGGIGLVQSSVSGSIFNSGTIIGGQGAAVAPAAVAVSSSTVSGGITNSGVIQASGSQSASALRLTAASTASIVNQGTLQADVLGNSNAYGVLLQGSTLSGDIANQGVNSLISASGTNQGAAFGVYGYQSTIAGSITNAGTIAATAQNTAAGVYLQSVNVAGSVVNSGTIQASGASAAGLRASATTIVGGIANAGLISAQGGTDANGVLLQSASAGPITNSGTIQASATGASATGLSINSASTIQGSIINQGSDSLISGNALTQGYGVRVIASTITGALINQGTIEGAGSSYLSSGISLESGSLIASGITNQGTISGSGAGIYASTSTVSGGLVNQAGAVIAGNTANAYGVGITNFSTLSGGISNAGTISSPFVGLFASQSSIAGGITNTGRIAGASSAGIHVWYSGVSGGITNSGVISGGSLGMEIEASTVSGTLTNSGTILSTGTGATSAAIEIAAHSSGGVLVRSTLTGSIVNSGTISSAAGIGIAVDAPSSVAGITNSGQISGGSFSLNLANSANAFAVVNTGTLSGNVNLGINSLALNGSSARVVGNVTGTGTVNVNGSFSTEGSFTVGTFNVNPGASLNLNNSVTVGSGGFNNSGSLNIGLTTQTITGSYVQSASGALNLGLVTTTTAHGVLDVVGNAAMANGTTINVALSGPQVFFPNGSVIQGVLVSTSPVATTASNIVVNGGSNLFSFVASTARDPDQVDLVTKVNQNAFSSAIPQGNTSDGGVSANLQGILNNGVPVALLPVYTALTTQTTSQLGTSMAQMRPVLDGGLASVEADALRDIDHVLQSCQTPGPAWTAMAETYAFHACARAWGAQGHQDDHNGATGFRSHSHGFLASMDVPIDTGWRAGGAIALARQAVHGNDASAPDAVDVDTYDLTAFSRYQPDERTDLTLQLDVSHAHADSTRALLFLGTSASAGINGFAWHASAAANRSYTLANAVEVKPVLRIDVTQVIDRAYTEQGAGAVDLQVDGAHHREGLFSAAATLAHPFAHHWKAQAEGSVAYDFLHRQNRIGASLVGGGSDFVTNGIDPSPMVYRLGAGLTRSYDNGLDCAIRYDIEARTSGYLEQTVSAQLRWSF